jgi:hypothetical protein
VQHMAVWLAPRVLGILNDPNSSSKLFSSLLHRNVAG